MCMNGKLRVADGTGKILPNMSTVELDTSLWFLLFLLLLGFFCFYRSMSFYYNPVLVFQNEWLFNTQPETLLEWI